MISLDLIVDELLPEAQTVPRELIIKTILATLKDFCLATRVYKASFHCFIPAGQSLILVTNPKHIKIAKIDYIRLGTGDIINEVMTNLEHFTLQEKYLQSANRHGYAFCAVYPDRSATSLEEDFYFSYAKAIKHGTLYRLKTMKGREWFDADIAMFHKGEYQVEINTASSQTFKKYLNSPIKKKSEWI